MAAKGKGLRDWIWQRATAIYLLAYVILMWVSIYNQPVVEFEHWQALFGSLWMQVASTLALFAMLYHAWIGIWTVMTDYVHHVTVRTGMLFLLGLVLFGYLVWGLAIVWGAI